MKPLTVVVFCFRGSRPIYFPWQVENARRMLAKHLTVPHRFVCITDDVPAMQAAGIEALPIWDAPAFDATRNHWLHNYVRLGLFDRDIGGRVGERILAIDLDMVIRSNIDDYVSNPAPFRVMAMKSRPWLQGGLFLVEPETFDDLVETNPWRMLTTTDIVERSRRWVGSDQAVLSELFYDAVRAGAIPTYDESHDITINDWSDSWRVFFRTGQRKCWDRRMPEYGAYYEQSGRQPDDVPPKPPMRRVRRGGLVYMK